MDNVEIVRKIKVGEGMIYFDVYVKNFYKWMVEIFYLY